MGGEGAGSDCVFPFGHARTLLFEAGEALAPESLVELTFHLPEQLGNLPAGQLTCVGKVVRQPPITESLPPRAAARFLEWRQRDDTPFES